jgi:hypothetical protein
VEEEEETDSMDEEVVEEVRRPVSFLSFLLSYASSEVARR